MTHIECPSCDQPVVLEATLPDTATCPECLAAWSFADPEPVDLALAA